MILRSLYSVNNLEQCRAEFFSDFKIGSNFIIYSIKRLRAMYFKEFRKL